MRTQATILRFEPELHKALRIEAIEQGVTMNEAVNRAVRAWLKEAAKARKGVKR